MGIEQLFIFIVFKLDEAAIRLVVREHDNARVFDRIRA